MSFFNNHPAGRFGGVLGLGVVLVAIAAIPIALNIRVDNSLERWINASPAAATDYRNFLDAFGSDEFMLVVYDGGDPFDLPALDVQLAMLETIEDADDVANVLGIPVVFRDIYGAEDAEALRDEFNATPFYDAFLYNAPTRTAGLIVELEREQTPDSRTRLVNAVRAAVVPMQAAGWTVHLAGSPLLNVVLDEVSQQESQRTFPLAILCSSIVLVLLFRSVRALFVSLICGGLTIVLTIALMAFLNYPFTMVTSVLPVLLWVLSLAGIIHLLRAYQRHGRETGVSAETLRTAYREVAVACVLASVTTAFGFLSLRMAGMDPVRELGLFACAGLLISLAVNLLLGPALILALRVPVMSGKSTETWSRRCARLPLRAPRSVALLCLLLIAPGIASIAWVRVEVNPLAFIPADSPTVKDYAYIAENLSGYYTLETMIETPGGWLDQAVWSELDELAATLGHLPGVARVLSPMDILRKLNQWDGDLSAEAYRLPNDSAEAKRLVDEMDDSMRTNLARLVAADGKHIRLSLLVNVMSSAEFIPIIAGTESALAALPSGYSGFSTGIVPQIYSAQLGLVSAQMRSFSLASFIILLCLLIGLRSIKLVLISIPANLLPILAAFATMSIFGIALDAATVMVASVALGIAVDDTVHMLSAYRRKRAEGEDAHDACKHALATVGPAMAITTLTACIGFFALLRSAFLPIAWFGLLSGVAMVAALLADYFLVPALILSFQRKTKHRNASSG